MESTSLRSYFGHKSLRIFLRVFMVCVQSCSAGGKWRKSSPVPFTFRKAPKWGHFLALPLTYLLFFSACCIYKNILSTLETAGVGMVRLVAPVKRTKRTPTCSHSYNRKSTTQQFIIHRPRQSHGLGNDFRKTRLWGQLGKRVFLYRSVEYVSFWNTHHPFWGVLFKQVIFDNPPWKVSGIFGNNIK